MKHRFRWERPAACLSLALLPLTQAIAQVFPQAIDYVMQLQTSAQSQSNPGRVSEALGGGKSSTVLVNTLGIAARIPLLSEDTRLDIAGVAGDARYSGQHQLDHHPRRADATLHWRASRLFNGNVSYQYDKVRNMSDRIWPESDTVATRRLGGEVGLNISEQWSFPVVSLFDTRIRYGNILNQERFDRNEKGWQVAVHYQDTADTSLRAGFRHSTTTYPLRRTAGLTGLDDEYKDSEIFATTFWRYSVKTALYARTGLLQRRYTNLSERNTNLFTLDTHVLWNYSPKTDLRLDAWHRPFNNDDNPDALYSTTSGIGLRALWRATTKVALALQASYEKQKDYGFGNSADVHSTMTRYGSRLSWQASPNISVILDGHHARKRGDSPWNQYTQNVLRVGLVFYTDSGNPQVAPMLRSRECQWSYVEADLCQ